MRPEVHKIAKKGHSWFLFIPESQRFFIEDSLEKAEYIFQSTSKLLQGDLR